MNFIILAFLKWISAFRHSCAQVSRHFMSWSPKLRNGSYFNWLLLFPWPRVVTTALCIRRFRDFAYRKFVIQVTLFLLSLHIAIRETPTWSWTNGPDMNLFQRPRLDRDITHREIEILVVLSSFHFEFVIPKTLIWAVINGSDQHLILRLRSFRNFAYHEINILDAMSSLPHEFAIPETPI